MSKPKILFMSCPEHGQLNCHLAVLASLLQTRASEVDLHLATFESARERCPPGVQYHALPGKGIGQRFKELLRVAKNPQRLLDKTVLIPPGFLKTVTVALPRLCAILNPATPDEYVDTVLAAMEVIRTVQPDLVVLDCLFSPGLDAVRKLDVPYVIMNPCTLKEAADDPGSQGWSFFKWPAINSGYPYPLPWHLVVPNLILCLLIPCYILFIDKTIKTIDKVRKTKLGTTDLFPILAPHTRPIICMSTPAIEYPGKVPSNIRACGPILQPSKPLEEVDKELHDWVMQGPLVLIVLGSHLALTETSAKEIFTAIGALLRQRKDVRVLLRYYKFGDFELPIDAAEFGDRLRTPSWLEADPISILDTGKVVAFVSHAGSNSWHEAVRTGVPQICLPAWFDCYDFAQKAEWLGIGRWANRKSAPHINQLELADAFFDVVGTTAFSPSAIRYREKAIEVRETVMGNRDLTGVEVNGVKRKGREGRDVAAGIIFDEAIKARAK